MNKTKQKHGFKLRIIRTQMCEFRRKKQQKNDIYNLHLLLLLLLRRPIPASDPADDKRPLFDELSDCADGDGHMEFWPTPGKPNSPEPDAETAAAAASNVSRSRRSAAARDSTYCAAN